MDKLYPPSIDGTIPAFYSDDGTTAEIVVPFTMNRSVSFNDIKGFCLKIKTIQTNTELEVLKTTNYTNNEAHFLITSNHALFSKIHIGQFLKVQLAYLYGDGINIENWDEGYYSTVGVIKYTSKPTIKINEFNSWDNDYIFSSRNEIEQFYNDEDYNSENTYKMPVFFSLSGQYDNDDKTEKPYLQKFSLYKKNVSNYTGDYELIETSDWFLYDLNNSNNNNYKFKSYLNIDYSFDYIINYTIKTINNLEINIFYLGCYENISQLENINFHAVNNSENVYVKLFFTKDNNFSFRGPIDIKIYKTDQDQDFEKSQFILTKKFVTEDDFLNWSFKDFLIEQGKDYQYYCLFVIQNQNFFLASNKINVDFEDCFLYDGKRQLKIKFNPKISSLKTNRLEQKIETIGSRYPFIFRNNTVEYKEFPISGLISYHMDDNEEFITKDELGIVSSNSLKRTSNPEQQVLNNIETLDLIDYNIRAERLFKLKVLDWLGNGEIKLFKSPTEGNYLVRLMNISLSPEDKLNRMIHSFSCIAYEIQECNYENLIKLIN